MTSHRKSIRYQAVRIYVSCGNKVVRTWAAYMLDHIDEVALSLRQEGIRHEMWLLGADPNLFVISVVDVDDDTKAAAVAQASTLSVDQVHRAFKAHWIGEGRQQMDIDPACAPRFEACELLFEAFAGPDDKQRLRR